MTILTRALFYFGEVAWIGWDRQEFFSLGVNWQNKQKGYLLSAIQIHVIVSK